MSTHAMVIITDGVDKVQFFRHSDGYPKETMKTLGKFMEWLKAGKIRDNVQQAAGWIILLGYKERLDSAERLRKHYPNMPARIPFEPTAENIDPMGWSAGAYEPCDIDNKYGNIHTYTINLVEKTLEHIPESSN
jgi:hypothetical protein